MECLESRDSQRDRIRAIIVCRPKPVFAGRTRRRLVAVMLSVAQAAGWNSRELRSSDERGEVSCGTCQESENSQQAPHRTPQDRTTLLENTVCGNKTFTIFGGDTFNNSSGV